MLFTEQNHQFINYQYVRVFQCANIWIINQNHALKYFEHYFRWLLPNILLTSISNTRDEHVRVFNSYISYLRLNVNIDCIMLLNQTLTKKLSFSPFYQRRNLWFWERSESQRTKTTYSYANSDIDFFGPTITIE